MGKLRPRGGRTLLKPYSDQVCSYDSQTFFTNSTNTNSNNFNLLEVDDVSMSVPNLRFSAPDDKEKDKRILFSRFICDSLCQTNLESKSSCPGHEITHTHTHTQFNIIGFPAGDSSPIKRKVHLRAETFLFTPASSWILFISHLFALELYIFPFQPP